MRPLEGDIRLRRGAQDKRKQGWLCVEESRSGVFNVLEC